MATSLPAALTLSQWWRVSFAFMMEWYRARVLDDLSLLPCTGEEWPSRPPFVPSRLNLSCGRHGHISLPSTTLLYQGRGSRSDPASYRPIALLNTDAKLLAKALADRWDTHLCSVVDGTKTAFFPGGKIKAKHPCPPRGG